MKNQIKDKTDYSITTGDRVMINLRGWKFREVIKQGSAIGVIISKKVSQARRPSQRHADRSL